MFINMCNLLLRSSNINYRTYFFLSDIFMCSKNIPRRAKPTFSESDVQFKYYYILLLFFDFIHEI